MNMTMLVVSLLLAWGAVGLSAWKNQRWEQEVKSLYEENNRLTELYLKSIERELHAHEEVARLSARTQPPGLEY